MKVKYDGVWTPAKDRRPGRDERSSEVSKFVEAMHNKRNAVPACFHEVHALYLHVRPCVSSSAPLRSSPPYLGGSLVIAKSMRARHSCTGPHLLHHTTTFGQEQSLRHGPSLLSGPFFCTFFWTPSGAPCSERAPGQYGRAHRATELKSELYLAIVRA